MQNFNPINLERKLDSETEKEMVKPLWDECITHDFVQYMYKIENYVVISKPNITYQKANEVVKNFINEDKNRINYLKFKIEEKFKLIHYIYSLLFSKILFGKIILEFKIKPILILIFKLRNPENKMEQ